MQMTLSVITTRAQVLVETEKSSLKSLIYIQTGITNW